jgi:hypothetical protein
LTAIRQTPSPSPVLRFDGIFCFGHFSALYVFKASISIFTKPFNFYEQIINEYLQIFTFFVKEENTSAARNPDIVDWL